MTAHEPWPRVGAVDPRALSEARLQTHHAAQLVVALGVSLLPRREDDSHTNLEWIPALRALATNLAPGDPAFRGGLRIEDLTLLMLDQGNTVWAELPLSGWTIRQAFTWIKDIVAQGGGEAGKITLEKHYTIPHHPVADGAPFALQDPAEFGELAAYYAGADLLLREVAREHGASDVRCWPHHFDIATLISLGTQRTIGAGLSPGDENYSEPYYYVTPYPYPSVPLPELETGHWHTKGWVGAVLPGSALAGAEGDGQRPVVEQFLKRAIARSAEALAGA